MRRGLVYSGWTVAAQLADERFVPASAALLVLAVLMLSEITLVVLAQVVDREGRVRGVTP